MAAATAPVAGAAERQQQQQQRGGAASASGNAVSFGVVPSPSALRFLACAWCLSSVVCCGCVCLLDFRSGLVSDAVAEFLAGVVLCFGVWMDGCSTVLVVVEFLVELQGQMARMSQISQCSLVRWSWWCDEWVPFEKITVLSKE